MNERHSRLQMNIWLCLPQEPAEGVIRILQIILVALLSPFGFLGFCLFTLTQKLTREKTPEPVQVSGFAVPGWDLV